MAARPTRSQIPLLSTLLALLLLPAAPVVARSQTVIHVGPEPPADSIAVWGNYARAMFPASSGDSVTGQNYRAFEAVGLIARRLMRQYGRGKMLLARAAQQTLDSLGFTTEAAEDPTWPGFAFLMVRNPSRPTADAVGFLYWYRQDDLRMQGVVFRGGHQPRMKVWRSLKHTAAYEWGVIDKTREGHPGLTLLGLNPDGGYWDLEQDEESLPFFSAPGEAEWADVNDDGIPEVVSWTQDKTDSLFTECMDCPKLLTQRLYALAGGEEGMFALEDERLLPTPYATLVYFIRLLIDGKLAQAQRLLHDPAKVHMAIAEGWNKRVVRHAWSVEARESGWAWPRRLQVRFQGPAGVKRYDVVFGQQGAHWLIEDWFEPKSVTDSYPSVAVPAAPGAKRPAAGAKSPSARPPAKSAPARPKGK